MPHTDNSYVGRDLGVHEYMITPELVDRFVRGTGDDNPRYRGSPAAAIAPALILHSECYSTVDWYLPRIYGNLHTRQEWDLFAPVKLGEKVTARRVVTDRYVKRDREYVVCEVMVF